MKKILIAFLLIFTNSIINGQTAVLLKDITQGLNNFESEPNHLINVNGVLFFSLRDNTNSLETLWKSDGTVNGTVLVKSFPVGNGTEQFTNVNGVLYFILNYMSTGNQLWKSNGTTIGTTLVKTFPAGRYPFNLVNMNGTLFFSYNDVATGIELWKSDGTFSGTVLVKDINPSSNPNTYPSVLTNINGTLFFGKDDGINGLSLWKSNGLASGTVLVKNISPKEYDYNKMFVDVNGIAYFTATDNINGIELWRSDGTNIGTTLVKDLNPGVANSNIKNLISSNGFLFFTVINPSTNGKELWLQPPGSTFGPSLLKQILNGSEEGSILGLTTVNGILFFYTEKKIMIDSNSYRMEYELWKSNGTVEGTVSVKNFESNYYGLNNMQNFNNTLFFSIDGLWKSDGTFEGTIPLTDAIGNPDRLTPINNILFFTANNGINGRELWKYGPTCAPAQPVSIIGNTKILQGTNETYSIEAVPGATSYLWTLPPGWSGSSITNSITVVVGATSEQIAVSAVNNCGISAPSILEVGGNTSSITQTISSGFYHTLVICNNGTINAWGTDFFGTLGNGTSSSSFVPIPVKSLTNIIAVAASDESSLALKNDGSVWAWGSNQYGQLGNGTDTFSNVPIQVSGISDVTSITGGKDHFLALKNDGTVWAWGRNGSGELGIGTTVNSKIPVQVLGLDNITMLSGGSSGTHSLAIKNDGTVWAWGSNFNGQLGNVTRNGPQKTIPIQVTSLNNIMNIVRGDTYTLALKNDGTVWAFGGNEYGELGNGTNGIDTYSGVPTQILGLSDISAIQASYGHAIALKNDGTAWAWGHNYYGELGNGTNKNSNIPVMVNGLTEITQISIGKDHTHAMKNDGTVWSWGLNLGNGSNTLFTSSNIPVQVTGLCNTLDIDENLIQNSVLVYPNPSKGIINLDLTDVNETELTIYNVAGQKVFTKKINEKKSKLDLNKFNKGIYFLNFKNNDGASIKKIILDK